MLTLENVIALYGGMESDWRQHQSGAWIHAAAIIESEAKIYGGVFRGGVFRGGEFHDGEFRGGEFRDGEFHGGEFHGTPLLIEGILPWTVNVDAPYCLHIGCEYHSLDYWDSNLETIALRHPSEHALRHVPMIRQVLVLARAWCDANNMQTAIRSALPSTCNAQTCRRLSSMSAELRCNEIESESAQSRLLHLAKCAIKDAVVAERLAAERLAVKSGGKPVCVNCKHLATSPCYICLHEPKPVQGELFDERVLSPTHDASEA